MYHVVTESGLLPLSGVAGMGVKQPLALGCRLCAEKACWFLSCGPTKLPLPGARAVSKDRELTQEERRKLPREKAPRETYPGDSATESLWEKAGKGNAQEWGHAAVSVTPVASPLSLLHLGVYHGRKPLHPTRHLPENLTLAFMWSEQRTEFS